MGLLDNLLGRTKPVQANLDDLFALPSAAVTIEAGAGLKPMGVGSVCIKGAEGGGFASLKQQIDTFTSADNDTYESSTDSFGFTWVVRRGDPADVSDLVSDLHGINSSLAENGFGTTLLCTMVPFSDGSTPPVGLIYLYKRGTWYPFAPTGPQTRDTQRELQLRAVIGDDLRIESDLTRWMPVWGAPGL